MHLCTTQWWYYNVCLMKQTKVSSILWKMRFVGGTQKDTSLAWNMISQTCHHFVKPNISFPMKQMIFMLPGFELGVKIGVWSNLSTVSINKPVPWFHLQKAWCLLVKIWPISIEFIVNCCLLIMSRKYIFKPTFISVKIGFRKYVQCYLQEIAGVQMPMYEIGGTWPGANVLGFFDELEMSSGRYP